MPDDLDTSDRSGMARVNLAAALHTHTHRPDSEPLARRGTGHSRRRGRRVRPRTVVTRRAQQVVRLLESAGNLDNDEAVRRVDVALTVAREPVGRGGNG